MSPIVHTEELLGIIVAGGAGSRLAPLTRDRAKPAVPIAGNM
jgi:glucose-1-phosphate adenylyltransferase